MIENLAALQSKSDLPRALDKARRALTAYADGYWRERHKLTACVGNTVRVLPEIISRSKGQNGLRHDIAFGD